MPPSEAVPSSSIPSGRCRRIPASTVTEAAVIRDAHRSMTLQAQGGRSAVGIAQQTGCHPDDARGIMERVRAEYGAEAVEAVVRGGGMPLETEAPDWRTSTPAPTTYTLVMHDSDGSAVQEIPLERAEYDALKARLSEIRDGAHGVART